MYIYMLSIVLFSIVLEFREEIVLLLVYSFFQQNLTQNLDTCLIDSCYGDYDA